MSFTQSCFTRFFFCCKYFFNNVICSIVIFTY
nr:MAG TPA: hypothetical protein [Caudoviricetes sp.]